MKTMLRRDIVALVFGAALVSFGFVLVGIDRLDASVSVPGGGIAWPAVVLGVGVVLVGVATRMGSLGRSVAPVGGVVAVAGLVLGVQSVVGLWSTWAYLWTLVVLSGAGLGTLAYGRTIADTTTARTGRRAVAAGFVVTAAGFVFFEVGVGLNDLVPTVGVLPALAVLLVVTGLAVVGYTLYGRGRRPANPSDATTPVR